MYDLAEDIIELSQRLAEQWDTFSYPEKENLLRAVLLNCAMTAATLVPTYRCPFDIMAEGASVHDGRGGEI